MRYCPVCKMEYGPQEKYCAACTIELVDSLPSDESVDAGALALVELARFSNVSEAEMIRELLETNAIGTTLRGELDPIGVASGAEPTALLVEEKDFLRAQELYQAYFAGDEINQTITGPE